jgi:aldehyde:ferredoxin oxidoreductase
VHEAAVKIGGEAAECAMVVKGEEIEQYELRAFKSMALTAALNAGSVADGLSFEYAILRDQEAQDAIARYAKEHYGSGDVLRPNSYKKKGLIVSDYENLRIALDLLGMCRWAFASTDGTSLDTPAALFSLATGRDISPDDLLRAASRTKTLERAFNVRKGIGRGDDTLPKRMFETAVPGGRWAGASLNREKFDRMLDEYYAARTWDKDGAPTAETFAQFGLESEWQAFVEHSPHKSSPAEDLVDDG